MLEFLHAVAYLLAHLLPVTPQWGAEDAEVKVHLVRTQSWNVLPSKPGVGQYVAIHAKLTARNFFLAYFLPFRSIHLHFFQTSPEFFSVGRG